MNDAGHLDWEALDRVRCGEGSSEERAHLAACAACRAELDAIERVAGSLKQRIADAGTGVPNERDDAILAAARGRAAAIRSRKLVRLPWWRQPRALALAASLMVAGGAGYLTFLQRDAPWERSKVAESGRPAAEPPASTSDAPAAPAVPAPATASAPAPATAVADSRSLGDRMGAKAPGSALEAVRAPARNEHAFADRQDGDSKLTGEPAKKEAALAKTGVEKGRELDARLRDTEAMPPAPRTEERERLDTLGGPSAGKDIAGARSADALERKQDRISMPTLDEQALDQGAVRQPAAAAANAPRRTTDDTLAPASPPQHEVDKRSNELRAEPPASSQRPEARESARVGLGASAEGSASGGLAASAAVPQPALPREESAPGVARDAAPKDAAPSTPLLEQVEVAYRVGANVSRTIRETYTVLSPTDGRGAIELTLAPGERARRLDLVEPVRRSWPASADGAARWTGLDLPAGRIVLETTVEPRPLIHDAAGEVAIRMPLASATTVTVSLTPDGGYVLERVVASLPGTSIDASDEGGWHLRVPRVSAAKSLESLTLRVLVRSVR